MSWLIAAFVGCLAGFLVGRGFRREADWSASRILRSRGAGSEPEEESDDE